MMAVLYGMQCCGCYCHCAAAAAAAVPVGPGTCRLLNRNTFKFNKPGLGTAVARAVMRLVPGWAVHMGTQVQGAVT